jgi:hypothetical protein
MTLVTHITHLGFAALLLVAGIAAATEAQMYKGYETPPYTVIRADGPIELREYALHIVAQVAVEGARSGAGGRGFRTLAKYIFGGNDEDAKVAMTTPVAQIPLPAANGEAETWGVTFTMPSQYDLTTLPQPKNTSVNLEMTKAETQAVIRFSGFWTDRSLAQQTEALKSWIAHEGLISTEAPRYYFYDDPFTLPFKRRNEVAIVVQ